MKILMLCGYFAPENQAEVIRHARAAVEFSSNELQRKLIGGFRTMEEELFVVSAPFIGSYPNASDIRVFRGFEDPQEACRYVPFNNIWGLRNMSRAASLKKAIRFFIEDPCREKLILVYCAHTPFLEAAAYAKKRDPRIRVSFYVPDLPNYMNLNANRSKFYDFAKALDNANMARYMACVDSYVLLTEEMKSALPVGDKPCMVAEGIMEDLPCADAGGEAETDARYIVYTGKLNEKFGIRDLIDGFRLLPDQDCRLVLCGTGDSREYVADAARQDPRILALGQIPPEEARIWQNKAAVLINPRPNNEAYTKYSFPSKLVEYLLTGRSVAAYMLDGMPPCYRDFLYEIDPALPNPEAIRDALLRAMSAPKEDRNARYQKFIAHAQHHLRAEQIVRQILRMTC